MTTYSFYRTRYGIGCLVCKDGRLKKVYLPYRSKEQLESRLEQDFPQAEQGSSEVDRVFAHRLECYFRGENISFANLKSALDCSEWTEFGIKVLEATCLIPFGETRSYRWVAEQAGSPRAFRAAGSVLARNRWPVIFPCHRVIKSDGSRGGWSGEPGWKERLQQLEKSVHGESRSFRLLNSPTSGLPNFK